MTRYFFDVVDGKTSAYDFRGREFSSPAAAYSLAELLALDLSVREPVSGKAISVADARGRRYFLVPVEALDPEQDDTLS